MIWGSGAFQGRRAASCGARPGSLLRAALLGAVGFAAIGAGAVRAETIGGALIKAYLTNPDINTQRAAVRVADEGVPKANAGYLPTVEGTANIGIERAQTSLFGPNATAGGSTMVDLKPRGYGVNANETVFNGNRTLNSIRQAESQVFGAREQLRNTEQNTLLSGVTAYMDVLRGHGHPRSRSQQCRCAEGAAARDTGPLHGRRSDAHRRGAGGGEPRQRARRPRSAPRRRCRPRSRATVSSSAISRPALRR